MSEHDDALLLLIELANRYVDKVSDVRRILAGPGTSAEKIEEIAEVVK